MSKVRRILAGLLVAILFGAGLYSGFKLSGWRGFSASPKTYSTPVLLQQVQTLSELVTVKYVMEKVQVLEVPSENLLGQALGSQNRILMLAHGIVKAGIDFKKMKPQDLQVKDKQIIIIRLPPSQITDAYLDEKQTRVIDRQTGLLAPSDKDLEQTTRQGALFDIQRAARENGILKDAEERAQTQLKVFFQQLGFEKVEFAPRTPALIPDLRQGSASNSAR
jgi:hypothetical protein